MTATNIPEFIFDFPIEDRITLADRLYASVRSDWQGWADREALAGAERRADEIDANPEMCVTHEQCLAAFLDLRAAVLREGHVC
jgi:hypothetical protein